MKKWVLLLCLLPGLAQAETTTEPIDQFGSARIYAPQDNKINDVVVILSPSNGWDNTSETIATSLVADQNLVLGLDVARYYADRKKSKDECLYPSGLIEDILETVQKKYIKGDFKRASLLGLGDSGGLASATAMQTLPGTYDAVLAPQFCDKIAAPKPLCLGERLARKGMIYTPKKTSQINASENYFLARSQTCADVAPTWSAAEPTDDALGFIKKNLREDALQDTKGQIETLADLPLVYLPGKTSNPWLIVFYSGDGGWRDIDRQIGQKLQKKGFSIIGVDSLRAFWHRQTPEAVAKDLDRIIQDGKKSWHKNRVAVMGFSFGADILPFVVPLLSDPKGVEQAVFLMLGKEASFEITVGAYFGKGDKNFNITQALKTWPNIPSLCFYGKAESKNTACVAQHAWMTPFAREGGHHFNKSYAPIAAIIADRLETSSSTAPPTP